MQGKIFSNQRISITCLDANFKKINLTLEAKKTDFETKPAGQKYGIIGEITAETKIEFDMDDQLLLAQAAEQMDITKLEEVVGGISEQLKTLLHKVILSRGPLKKGV